MTVKNAFKIGGEGINLLIGEIFNIRLCLHLQFI